VNADLTIERETYEQSRSGLNEMYLQAQKELEGEKRDKKVRHFNSEKTLMGIYY